MTDELDDDLRARLRNVPGPDPAGRERALAAAMAVFEEQHAPPRRSTRWLMPVAAALVGVVALGGALTLVDSDADDEQAADRTADSVDADELRAEAIEVAEAGEAAATLAAAETAAADVMAAEAAPAASSAAALLVLLTDDDVVAAVSTTEASVATTFTACDREIVTEASDQRDPDAPRPVLLTIEDTADGSFVVVLAPEGAPDACTEIGRLPLP